MLSYKQAGVDIAAGDRLVDAIKPQAQKTQRLGTMGGIGGFGAIFDIKALGYQDPLLISTCDGVGTKILLARDANNWQSIGQDLVAMCVNDLLVQGAEPLYFLDYLATGKLDVSQAQVIINSISQACQVINCALVGGETAEMPGLYKLGDLDLAGFAVGAVERQNLLPKTLEAGQVVLGLASNGLHSNGFSLVRKVLEHVHEQELLGPCAWDNSRTLEQALLTPTRIYVNSLLPLMKQGLIAGAAHVTGGGLAANFARVLPKHLSARLVLPDTLPPRFAWVQTRGKIATGEMLKVFNCGVGFVLVVDAPAVQQVSNELAKSGENVLNLGVLESRCQDLAQVTVQM